MKENRPWVIWLTIMAVILAGVGIFFYYNFFRQSKSELIEAIPTDAAFILTLNDNDGFISSTPKVAPYLNELLVMDALPAYETMRNKLPNGEYDLTVSGHGTDNGVSVLFNMHADKAAFKRLLRALSIDPNNYTPFEGNRIYTYGTNFKSMKFVYLNHIISISPDLELLKRAIVQHAHPKDLLSDKQFKEMYDLTDKNRKQNWLIVNPERYGKYFSSFLNEETAGKLSSGLKKSGWTALQLRVSGNEMFLSGYVYAESPQSDKFDILINKNGNGVEINDLYPSQANWYVHLETPRVKELSRLKNNDPKASKPFMDLSPSEIGYFTLQSDSVEYQYAIVKFDTANSPLEVFYSHAADSVRALCPDEQFPIPYRLFPLMPAFAPDSAKWFIIKDNSLVFAESKEGLKLYQKNMKEKGCLTQNRYYPFVNEAVASTAVFTYTLFNNETSSYWLSLLSDKGKASHVGRDLHVFTLSCDAMGEGQHLLPLNLYLLF